MHDFKQSTLLIIALFSLIVVSILTLGQRIRFFDGDEWTTYFVTRHFSKGEFSIDRHTLESQRKEAQRLASRYGDGMGGLGLGGYRKRPDGRYILEKTPGYFVLLSFFHLFSAERLLNLLLAIGLTLSLLLLGKSLLNQSQVSTVMLLLLFTPAALIMLYRPYMESYASFAFVTLGGVLYLVAETRPIEKGSVLNNTVLYAFCGIFLGASLFCRTILLPSVMIFYLHRLFRLMKHLRSKEEWFSLTVMTVGTGIFLLALAVYNAKVNGSPLTAGYMIGRPKQSIYCFSFQYLLFGKPEHPWQIIVRNTIRMPELLMNGYPLLALALPGLWLAKQQIRRDIYWVLLFWFFSVYLLYMQFLVFNSRHFMVIGRLYLPALFPLALFSAFTIEKLGKRAGQAALFFMISLGIISFLYFLCHIQVDPFNAGILDTFKLRNFISYK